MTREPGDLGTYLRTRRLALGMTQEALAAKIGVTHTTISDIERGKVQLPGAHIRRGIADALGVKHVDLLIAAGELMPTETRSTPPPTDPPDVARLVDLVRATPLTPGQATYLRTTLEGWARHPHPDAADQTTAATAVV